MKSVPHSEVLRLLPESAESLDALASLGEADMAEHLQAWEQARRARLRHMIFRLSDNQAGVVEEAMRRVMTEVSRDVANPNRRGNALYSLCRSFLEQERGKPR